MNDKDRESFIAPIRKKLKEKGKKIEWNKDWIRILNKASQISHIQRLKLKKRMLKQIDENKTISSS